MSTFLYNPYIVKRSTKGEGVENVQKTVYVVYERHLKEMCQLLRKSVSIQQSNLLFPY